MKPKTIQLLIAASLTLSLILTGCALPSVTPPAQATSSVVPTITAPVVPTATTVPPTAVPQPEVITLANAAQLKTALIAPASNVQLITWSQDSKTLGISSQNMDTSGQAIYSVTLMNGNDLSVKSVWAAPSGDRVSAISPDGRLVAVISGDMRSMSMIDLGDGNKDVIAISPQHYIGGITFSPDGKYFTVSNVDTMAVTVNNLPDGSEFKTLSGFTTAAPVFDVGFAGNSSTLVWHARATIQLQDLASGKMGNSFNHEDFVSAFQLSPDGKILASAAGKTISGNFLPAVTLWDTAAGTELRTLVLQNPATSVSFSPDGTLLAVGSGNDVLVYEVSSGTLLATLSNHSALVSVVAFSPDGKSLVSSGQDNQLVLWQALK